MPASENTSAASIPAIEQDVLRLINGRAPERADAVFPIEELAQDLSKLHSCGAVDSRDQCFLMSQQFLADSKALPELVKLLRLRAQWFGNSPVYGEECRDVLASAASNRLGASIIESVAFGVEKPLECLKRVETLLRIVPGAACIDRAWGYGIVASLDDFYKKVTVDFDGKPGHVMSFSYAATALRPVDKTHILAVRHADKAAFDALCESDPAKIVSLAIESFGPMTVAQLEQELAYKILPRAAVFKDFWTRARSKLKSDKRYTVPPTTKKNEPIMRADSVAAIGDAKWFDSLSGDNAVPSILRKLGDLAKSLAPGAELEAARRAAVADRIAFVLKACAATREDKDKASVILLALRFGFTEIDASIRSPRGDEFAVVPGKGGVIDLKATLARPQVAVNAAKKLNAALLKEMVAYIPAKDDAAVAAVFIAAIPQMPYALLEAIAPQLIEGCASASFVEFVRGVFATADIPFHLILWICRAQADDKVAALLPASVVGTQAVLALEPEVTGTVLTMQHSIADCFKKKDWLCELSSRMLPEELAAFLVRIRAVDEGVWGPLKKREIEKTLVEKHPELAKIIDADAAAEALNAAPDRVTSLRSYSDRQTQLRELIDIKIPKNARDIDTARSYGDLRENFEYQAARDEQRMLLQQQIDMQIELRDVKPVNFDNIAFDGAVASGAEVELHYPDGAVKVYRLLGEWDSDLTQGIISSRSRIAELLAGRRAGDTVALPTEDEGTVDVKLAAVRPLPPEILDWAAGR